VADRTQSAAADDLLDRPVQRVVSLVEHDRKRQLRFSRGNIVEPFDLFGVDAGRLLPQHMNTVLKCIDSDLGLQVRRDANHHCIDSAAFQHRQVVVIKRNPGVRRLDNLPPGWISVANRADLEAGTLPSEINRAYVAPWAPKPTRPSLGFLIID
jgi:hypothetical protein